MSFLEELHTLIEKYCQEEGTSDYKLAKYVKSCVSINGVLEVIKFESAKEFIIDKEDEKFFNSLPEKES
jgi:hypothetical protein